jgi:hypothetical protein
MSGIWVGGLGWRVRPVGSFPRTPLVTSLTGALFSSFSPCSPPVGAATRVGLETGECSACCPHQLSGEQREPGAFPEGLRLA